LIYPELSSTAASQRMTVTGIIEKIDVYFPFLLAEWCRSNFILFLSYLYFTILRVILYA